MKPTKTLEQRVSKGVKARQELEEYSGRFQKLQARYLSELVFNARQGEPTESAVYKLVALDDVVSDLDQDVKTGVTAAQKLNEQTLQLKAQEER